MENFVDKQSIVRRIWGKADTVLFIFAGAAAEFALNKSVDWLYFTGKLPKDPLGRLFSTVSYARAIIFSEQQHALQAIDLMAKIHSKVEADRGYKIPDWAYRDVLFMLIDYSIRAFELLERNLSATEKHEVFDVFNRLGNRMGVQDLPVGYNAWLVMRKSHLQENLERSHYTVNLFDQYRKHLGPARYRILIESQKMIVPATVRHQLKFNKFSIMPMLLAVYKLARKAHLDSIIKSVILPKKYKKQINSIDQDDCRKCPF